VIVNGIGVVYQVLQARVTSAAMPVWSALRDAPPGVILTDQYWQAALYTHQPVTWFESCWRYLVAFLPSATV